MQFKILDLDVADNKFVSFCLILTFWGVNRKRGNSAVTQNQVLFGILTRFGSLQFIFFFAYTCIVTCLSC